MRLKLKARRRLSRILIARDKEWQKYLQNLKMLRCQGDYGEKQSKNVCDEEISDSVL